MKLSVNPIFCSLVLHLVTLAFAAASPLVDDVQPLGVVNATHTLSDAVPSDNLPGVVLVPRGYDPSTEWQEKAHVEIWTGGSSRSPVNYGDLRGSNLSDTIFALLDASCPPANDPLGFGCCPGTKAGESTPWKDFYTNALIEDDPSWKVDLRQAFVRVQGGCFYNEPIRIVMLQLAADTLRAFTMEDEGYNCYHTLGQWSGTYCNVPQLVRVNLPHGPIIDGFTINYNYMHIETWGIDKLTQFPFTKGELRPCKTRHLVDDVMDKYSADLVKLFPKRSWFYRLARVIIDGYKECTDEP